MRHSSPSCWCHTSPVTLLHICRSALDRSSLHRAEPNRIGSSARKAEQEFGIMKDKSSPTPSPHGLHGLDAPTSPLGHFINPALTTSQVMTSVGMAAQFLFLKLMSITPNCFNTSADMAAATYPDRPALLPRPRPGACPSLRHPTPETSASLADQLRHISRTGGFASASQPFPASPCHCFIAHQAMGVRIESQFWE